MHSKHSIQSYRRLYAAMLGCYPRSYRERYSEGMRQTFNDLCRERTKVGEGFFFLVLWTYIETTKGILKENMALVLTQNLAKRLSVWAIVVALILTAPLVAMQFTNEVDWGPFDFIIMGRFCSVLRSPMN